VKREGQDGANASNPAAARSLAPAARKKPGDAAKSVVFLRMRADAALALRTRAEVRRLSPSEYVTGLVFGEERPNATAEEMTLLDVSALAHAVHQLPGEVRRLKGELMRQGGLIKHLAETTPITARHDQELASTLRAMIDAAEQAQKAVSALLDATASARADIARAAKVLAAR
jgi:hypothetical protein